MSEHEETRVDFEVTSGVGVITLNRPESMNALSLDAVLELQRIVDRVTNDAAIRAAVITGAGRAFCAGADVKEWGDESNRPKPGDKQWVPTMHEVMKTLYWMPKPLIAAVNGVAVGAGCDLTLVADIRIASEKARFGEVYMNLGFSPDAGGSFLLPRIVGEARAAEMIYTARVIDADEAHAIGLVTEVHPADRLFDAAFAIAKRFAEGPTVAIGQARMNIRAGYSTTFEEALRRELVSGAICARTADHAEGMSAISEGRAPKFDGK